MCAGCYNPPKSRTLDGLQKSEILLLGISTSAHYKGRPDPIELSKELSRSLDRLGPRDDRKALYSELAKRWKASTAEAFGTEQIPIMLSFEAEVYAAFVPELMTGDGLQAFKTVWMLRNHYPRPILAYKEGRTWKYRLV